MDINSLISSNYFYHGTSSNNLESIKEKISIDNKKVNKYTDFGRGFYLTDNESVAKRHAINRTRRENLEKVSESVNPIVLKYEFNNEIPAELRSQIFLEPNNDWMNFILSNRLNKQYGEINNINGQNFDLVFGPIADGKPNMLLLLDEIEKGKIEVKDALERLSYITNKDIVVNQLSLHSDIIISKLVLKEITEIEV